MRQDSAVGPSCTPSIHHPFGSRHDTVPRPRHRAIATASTASHAGSPAPPNTLGGWAKE